MLALSKHRALLAGILSPLAALLFYAAVYTTLTSLSSDLKKDWLFRLSVSTLAMTAPFFITLALVVKDIRRHALFPSGKIGLGIAILSLGLTLKPVSDGISRSKQERNMRLRDVPAPSFDTTDIFGQRQRLTDYKGEVVLVNIWATWCVPCRNEMPRLDRLYQDQKKQGFIVLGISDESIGVQKRFLEQVPVSYPLLTLSGQVPNLYRDIAQYPAIFLIDRQGRLQPAPAAGQPFEKVEAAVGALLAGGAY